MLSLRTRGVTPTARGVSASKEPTAGLMCLASKLKQPVLKRSPPFRTIEQPRQRPGPLGVHEFLAGHAQYLAGCDRATSYSSAYACPLLERFDQGDRRVCELARSPRPNDSTRLHGRRAACDDPDDSAAGQISCWLEGRPANPELFQALRAVVSSSRNYSPFMISMKSLFPVLSAARRGRPWRRISSNRLLVRR